MNSTRLLTFPPSCRIRKKCEFDKVFTEGSSYHTDHFRFIAIEAQGTPSRLGLVVSKKTAKRAPDRNRIKRLVREAFRANRHNIDPPVDLVVVAKRGADKLTLEEVANEIHKALSRWRA